MHRRPGRTTLALALPILLLIAFGMARVAAPVGALGLLFDEPAGFAVVAAFISIAGAVLLFVPPVELAVMRAFVGSTEEPSEGDSERLDTLLGRVGARAGADPGRLIVRIQDATAVNAAAGAAHMLFVTRGALALPDAELEAVLAHELGHHHGLHPVLGAVVWWLRLPGAALAFVYRVLRRTVGVVGSRLGVLGRLLAIPLLALLLVWQVAVMWLFYVAEVLAMWAARVSEYEADAAAESWGYGPVLVGVYGELLAAEPDRNRLQRLMADHPPLPARIERLRHGAAAAEPVGVHP